MFRFTLRELILLTTIVALVFGWAINRRSLQWLVTENRQLQMQNDVLRPLVHEKQEEIDDFHAMRRAESDAYRDFFFQTIFYWGKQRSTDKLRDGISVQLENDYLNEQAAKSGTPGVRLVP
jgi:hypothetical protein